MDEFSSKTGSEIYLNCDEMNVTFNLYDCKTSLIIDLGTFIEIYEPEVLDDENLP